MKCLKQAKTSNERIYFILLYFLFSLSFFFFFLPKMPELSLLPWNNYKTNWAISEVLRRAHWAHRWPAHRPKGSRELCNPGRGAGEHREHYQPLGSSTACCQQCSFKSLQACKTSRYSTYKALCIRGAGSPQHRVTCRACFVLSQPLH